MKTILYGNDDVTMERVKKILEPLAEFKYVIVVHKKEPKIMTQYEDADAEAIIFVGICPANELEIALTIGLKVFVLLVPSEEKTSADIVICKTSINEEDKIREEFENFYEKKAG